MLPQLRRLITKMFEPLPQLWLETKDNGANILETPRPAVQSARKERRELNTMRSLYCKPTLQVNKQRQRSKLIISKTTLMLKQIARAIRMKTRPTIDNLVPATSHKKRYLQLKNTTNNQGG